MAELKKLDQVGAFHVDEERLFYSATHEEILDGYTTDVYFVKTREILNEMGKGQTNVVAEVFARKTGMFAGIGEVENLLKDKKVKVHALPEGSVFYEKEVVLRIEGPYDEFGMFETVILGMLASSSGWATATAEIVEAAAGKPVYSFGARHVHPAVAPVMERAALIGGASGASCIVAAKLQNLEPVGTVPHAIFLVLGDTLEGAIGYDKYMPENEPRLVLVDTFQDEAVETLRIADYFGERLKGIRLDTPSERGGVTQGLVREIRARLDMSGHQNVQIFVSGGLTPERIELLKEAGADAFGVGSYISGASAIDMTMDLKVVDGKPIAKRGRIPGLTETSRLKRII
ncbi:nicotinate phosphoribosyltransferase [Clostridia bacterium]|nr:nicotinate phosphoribosyltransferase [Clostridia bacterium]